MKNLGLLFVILTGSVVAQNAAVTTRTSDYAFPLVGLASTETIGVNLINLASNPTAGTAASCAGSVSFVNAAGATIGTATTFTLTANAVTSVNLAFSGAGLTGIRGLIRTVVATTTTSGVPCALSYSLNTFDTATGATHVFLAVSGPVTIQPFTNPGH
jgi:hypothetical protein